MTGETRASRDLHESLLELRDEMIGIQAQLDELQARVDGLERRLDRRVGSFARVRARMGRARRHSASDGGSVRQAETRPPPA